MSAELLVETHGDHEDLVLVETKKFPQLLGLLSDWLLVALVFLFPLFFIFELGDPLELPKQILLISATTLVGILWLARVFISRALVLRRSFFFFPLALFLVVSATATITSLDRYASLFGGQGGEYLSFASLVGFALFLFFSVSSSSDFVLVRRLLMGFFGAATILGVGFLLRTFGLSIPGLSAAALWNPVGSVFSLGIFEAVVVALASGTLLLETHKPHPLFTRSSFFFRSLALVAGLAGLVVLVSLDWWVTWMMVLLGAGSLLIFVFIYAHSFRALSRLILPLLGFVLAILFLFIQSPLRLRAPVEIGPNTKTSFEVSRRVLQERPAFGSGPATYAFDFAKHRPKNLSLSPFWNVRFDRASGFFLTLLPTMGLVGIIVFLLSIGVIIGLVGRSFFREEEGTARLLVTVLSFAWAPLLVAAVFYPLNMTLMFLFWFVTTLLVVATSRSLSTLTFSASPRALLGTSLGAIVFVVLMVILLLLGISRALAWASFNDAVLANARGDFEKTREHLVRAADRDPRIDVFARNLAQVRFFEAVRAKTSPEIQTLLNAALVGARRAATLSPMNVSNWAMLGSIAREMTPLVGGAGELALDAFERASELEPGNPIYPTERGRVELLVADRARGETQSKDEAVRAAAFSRVAEHLANAERLFGEAIELKQDYAPAHFYTALVLERQGRLVEAIGKMESVTKFNPRDVGVAFQLGILYLKNKQLDKAEKQFTYALELAPNYANARWYLASIYEARGKLANAIREIEAVLATNPENQAVKERLAALRAGQASRELPAPVSDEELSELRR